METFRWARVRNFAGSLLICAGLVPNPAGAALREARDALARNDFETTRRELEAPDTKNDTQAMALLATLLSEGKGGPRDLLEAYKLDTLVFMEGSADERASVVGPRRMIARRMSQGEIREAEGRVVAVLTAREGREALRAKIEALRGDLAVCAAKGFGADACYAPGYQLLPYGPAGVALIPALERLMTSDLHWQNRELYAAGLAAIGTQAVPALVRVMRDKQQMQREGIWNALQAMTALGWIGPGAAAALPDLLAVFVTTPPALGTQSDFLKSMGVTREAMVLQLRLNAAYAILKVRDPDRTIAKPLRAALASERDPLFQLIEAWVIGLLYDEPQDGIRRAVQALSSGNPEFMMYAFAALGDLSVVPGASKLAPEVLPALTKLMSDPDPEIVTEARTLTDRVSMPWAGEAIQFLRKGEAQQAIAPITRYIEAVPWQDAGYMVRAEAYKASGQPDKAAADLIKAAEVSGVADWMRGPMLDAGLLKGADTGELDADTRRLLPECLASEPCWAAVKSALAPRLDMVLEALRQDG